MSNPSSVASSVVSFRSSASSQASNPWHATKTQDDSDGEVGYSMASFEVEDPPESEPGTAEKDDSADDYEDDEFEDVGEYGDKQQVQNELVHGDVGREEVEYSDDFSEPEEKDDRSVAVAESGSESSDFAPTAGACDRATQLPSDDLLILVEDWARQNTRIVSNRLQSSANASRTSVVSRQQPSGLAEGVIATISARLMQRRSQSKISAGHKPCRRSKGFSVPTSVVDRVHVHHLVALSTISPPSLRPDPSQDRSLHKDSISTFCAEKTADLSGKLATMRLEDMDAKWHVPPADEHASSRGVLEFLASTAHELRASEILRSSGGDDCVLRAMKTQTVGFERTVQEAKDAVVDSQALMKEAQRILSAPDARPCRCVFHAVF